MTAYYIVIKVEAPTASNVMNATASIIEYAEGWAPGFCIPISINVQPCEPKP